MSETPRLLVQRIKSSLVLDDATPDEIRAAVVPLLDYEAAMECESLHGFTELSRRLIVEDVVNAALGLEEPTDE